jgi:hypothetical protein
MTAPDKHNTPPELVAKMLACATVQECRTVADFSAGDGALLLAAVERWPGSLMIATEVDGRLVDRLRKKHPDWIVSRCDFLDARSRAKCQAIHRASNGMSLILLNPPFSGRGGKKWRCELHGESFKCSQALAFAVTALNFLGPDGQLVAILPASCVRSEKDRSTWECVSRSFLVRTIAENGRGSFGSCFASSVIVRFSRKAESPPQISRAVDSVKQRPIRRRSSVKIDIFRGKVQIHRAKLFRGAKGFPFIHSTEVKGPELVFNGKRIRSAQHFVQGPAVLLPRVGNPTSSKVAVYLGRRRIVLSDCVIALKCHELHHANMIHRLIKKNWADVARAFSATCAPYVTVADLATVLRRFVIVSAPGEDNKASQDS